MKRYFRLVATVIFTVFAVANAQAQSKLDQQITALSEQIATKMGTKQKTTLVVADFTDLQGNVTDFGRFLSEEITTRFYGLEKYKVVERQRFNKIITEQNLNLSNGIEPISAKQIGKSLGVDTIVAGTITNLPQKVRINARLFSTDTGEIFAVATTEIDKDDTVTGLLGTGINKPPISSKPAPQATTNKRPPIKILAGEEEFVFEFESCKMDAEATVLCYLTVKNNYTQDIRFHIRAQHYDDSTRLFDESGNEYIVDTVTFGTRVGNQREGATNTLVPQFPTKLILKFRNVSPQASNIALSIHCYLPRFGGGPSFKANIRDIRIEK